MEVKRTSSSSHDLHVFGISLLNVPIIHSVACFLRPMFHAPQTNVHISPFGRTGDVRGPAEETRGRSLARLEAGDTVKISEFMGRGFSSLLVGWIGLHSALQVSSLIYFEVDGWLALRGALVMYE